MAPWIDGVKWTGTSLERRVAKITAALSVSVGGYTLLENPRGYILALIYTTIRDIALGIAGEIGFRITQLFGSLWDVVAGGIGAAIMAPVGAISGLIDGMIIEATRVAVNVASSAGPFAPVVIALMWAGVAVIVIYALRFAWALYKWFRVTVI